MPNTIRKMSGCPIRPVRHIYRRIGGGPITNYSTIGGICKICPPVPPPPPPPPIPNIRFRVYSNVPYSVLFYLGGGSGTYDLGNGILIPWSGSLAVPISGIVPVGGTVLIYSNDIQIFNIIDQPVSYLDLSNCPTLKELICSQTFSGQSYLTGAVDLSGNPNLIVVDFSNTLISSLSGVTSCPQLVSIFLDGADFTQETADQLATDINTNESTFGELFIRNQVGGTININNTIYNILRGKNWTIS